MIKIWVCWRRGSREHLGVSRFQWQLSLLRQLAADLHLRVVHPPPQASRHLQRTPTLKQGDWSHHLEYCHGIWRLIPFGVAWPLVQQIKSDKTKLFFMQFIIISCLELKTFCKKIVKIFSELLAQLINEHNVNQKIHYKTRDLGHFT